MRIDETGTIYHLRRKNGSALFLHEYHSNLSTLDIEYTEAIHGRYGSDPRVESITALRNSLYRQIESDVRDWINERRFVPRFLLSAASFVVVYLFMALVIRDPVPFADEFLIATGAAVGFYLVLGRRFEQSKNASEKRASIRHRVDAITFEESHFVHSMEEILYRIESIPVGSLTESEEEFRPDIERIRKEHPVDVQRFLHYLVARPKSRTEKKILRDIKRNRLRREISAVSPAISVDLPILYLEVLLQNT